jgi:hypothetical protein
MIKLNINVTKIDKSAIHAGKNGKYIDLVCFENRNGPDQYGNDGFVTQEIPRERRDAGERGPIIGNFKRLNAGQAKPVEDRDETRGESDIPF